MEVKAIFIAVGLISLAGCQAVAVTQKSEPENKKPEYIKKVSAKLIEKRRRSHKITAEYDAVTGVFYQFASDPIVKSGIYIDSRPQSRVNMREAADELGAIVKDVERLKICNGERTMHESNIPDFHVSCNARTGKPVIYWSKCSEYITVCHSESWKLKDMYKMEAMKDKMRKNNILNGDLK